MDKTDLPDRDERDDRDMWSPKVGSIFKSLEEGKSLIKKWAAKVGFKVRTRDSDRLGSNPSGMCLLSSFLHFMLDFAYLLICARCCLDMCSQVGLFSTGSPYFAESQ